MAEVSHFKEQVKVSCCMIIELEKAEGSLVYNPMCEGVMKGKYNKDWVYKICGKFV